MLGVPRDPTEEELYREAEFLDLEQQIREDLRGDKPGSWGPRTQWSRSVTDYWAERGIDVNA